jgi:hypothetical protein
MTGKRELSALWTLVLEAVVETTKNRAERSVRCAVRWRKMGQCTTTRRGTAG